MNLPYKMKSNYMVEPFGLITSMTLDLQENKEENQIFEEEWRRIEESSLCELKLEGVLRNDLWSNHIKPLTF